MRREFVQIRSSIEHIRNWDLLVLLRKMGSVILNWNLIWAKSNIILIIVGFQSSKFRLLSPMFSLLWSCPTEIPSEVLKLLQPVIFPILNRIFFLFFLLLIIKFFSLFPDALTCLSQALGSLFRVAMVLILLLAAVTAAISHGNLSFLFKVWG